MTSTPPTAPATDAPRDFFVSYTAADRNWAVWIAYEIESVGYTVTIQEWDFVPGSNFMEMMDIATRSTKHTLALLSPTYLERAFPRAEMLAALGADPLGREKRLIPIRITRFELTGLLANVVHIDLAETSEQEARDRLFMGLRLSVGKARGKPSSPPLFPTKAALDQARFPLVSESTASPSFRRQRSRFLHSKVMGADWLDAAAIGHPYDSPADPTDSDVAPNATTVTAVFWTPTDQHFTRDNLVQFTPAVAICTASPRALLDQVRLEVGDDVFAKLALVPSKLFNADRERLFRAIGHAMHHSFVACIAVPQALLAPARRKPSLGLQTIVDLLYGPILAFHGTLPVREVSIRIADAGQETSFLIGQAKRLAKAVLAPSTKKVDVEPTSLTPDARQIADVARLLAWATSTAHNNANDRWTQLIDQATREMDGEALPMEASPPDDLSR